MRDEVKSFVLVSTLIPVLIEVLQAIHSFSDAECFVITPKRVPFVGYPKMAKTCFEANFDGEDDERVSAEINRLAEAHPGLVVIPCDCAGARMIDRLSGRIVPAVIPSPNNAMLDCFDDKWQFYQFCKENAISVPPSQFAGTKHDLNFEELTRQIGHPFVIKPLNETASVGLIVIDSEEQLRREVLDNVEYRYSPLIAQRYVAGSDICLNFLSLQGKITATSIQQRQYPQHPAAKIRFTANAYMEEIAETIAERSGYHGVMHVDARIEDGTGKIFLFESNPRFWRSLNASTWCGLNFVEQCLLPPPPMGDIRRLTSGSADTYYHPLVRPAFFFHALFSRRVHRRRLARVMVTDVWTLSLQVKGLLSKMKKSSGLFPLFGLSGRKRDA